MPAEWWQKSVLILTQILVQIILTNTNTNSDTSTNTNTRTFTNTSTNQEMAEWKLNDGKSPCHPTLPCCSFINLHCAIPQHLLYLNICCSSTFAVLEHLLFLNMCCTLTFIVLEINLCAWTFIPTVEMIQLGQRKFLPIISSRQLACSRVMKRSNHLRQGPALLLEVSHCQPLYMFER